VEPFEPLRAFLNLWEPFEPLVVAFGSIWEPLEAFGSLWEPLGAFGSLWEPLGVSYIVYVSRSRLLFSWDTF
jgi:hypothetical protein